MSARLPLLVPTIAVLVAVAGPPTADPPRPAPRHYICYRALSPLGIDGRLDEISWQRAAWSEPFVHILGDSVPPPPLRTRVKLLWDDGYLYVGAELEEPHLWATLTERDAVIYQDDDFEVFIDPDGDTYNYYEIEINAFGTVWDLFLVRPYRDGGPAITAWDITGLRSAVALGGTINDPSDRDAGWTVELAIPWHVLAEAAPGQRLPRDGETWRFNFSRVDWDLDVVHGQYEKRRNPDSGRPFAEHNWVWSPQGAVNMHLPERWGSVSFSALLVGGGG